MQNPNSKIMIVDSLDYICMQCSNTDGNRCLKYPRLDDVDREALTQFGLNYGKEYRTKDIIRLLKKNR